MQSLQKLEDGLNSDVYISQVRHKITVRKLMFPSHSLLSCTY